MLVEIQGHLPEAKTTDLHLAIVMVILVHPHLLLAPVNLSGPFPVIASAAFKFIQGSVLTTRGKRLLLLNRGETRLLVHSASLRKLRHFVDEATEDSNIHVRRILAILLLRLYLVFG